MEQVGRRWACKQNDLFYMSLSHILSALFVSHYFQKPNLSLPAENSESISPSQSDINVHRPVVILLVILVSFMESYKK